MTVQELYNEFKLRVGNNNFESDDFITLLNGCLRKISHTGKEYFNFANSFLHKEKIVEYHKDDKGIYINSTDLESDINKILEVEGQINKDDNKIYINLDYIDKINGNKINVRYTKQLDTVSNLGDNVNIGSYVEALLNCTIGEYYLLKTKDPNLSNYYEQKVLYLLSK